MPWLSSAQLYDMLGHGAFALVLYVIARSSRPVYLAFRKRRSGYGVVFNSITDLPEALATVRLVTPGSQGSLTASTAVTDKHGRYRLAARPGEYLVEVKKEGFVFPSRYLKEADSVYENILPAAHVIVKEHGIITKNIPIDPEHATAAQRVRAGFRLSKGMQYALAYLSPLVLVAYPLIRESWAAWIFFWWYIAIIVYRLFTYKPAQPAFGTVTDAATRQPLAQAVVRIFDTRFNKLLETQVTGERGRYAFVVHPGAYYVLIKKPGYRSVRVNFPAIKEDGFVLARDAALKLAPAQYQDEHPEPAGTPANTGVPSEPAHGI